MPPIRRGVTLPIDQSSLMRIYATLSPSYGHAVLTMSDEHTISPEAKLLVVRTPSPNPDPINDLEAAIEEFEQDETFGITHMLLVGEKGVMQIATHTLETLMEQRAKEDVRLAADLSQKLDRNYDYTIFRSGRDPRRVLRIGVRIPKIYVRDMSVEDLSSLARNISPLIDTPKARETKVAYIIGDQDFRRICAEELFDMIGAASKKEAPESAGRAPIDACAFEPFTSPWPKSQASTGVAASEEDWLRMTPAPRGESLARSIIHHSVNRNAYGDAAQQSAIHRQATPEMVGMRMSSGEEMEEIKKQLLRLKGEKWDETRKNVSEPNSPQPHGAIAKRPPRHRIGRREKRSMRRGMAAAQPQDSPSRKQIYAPAENSKSERVFIDEKTVELKSPLLSRREPKSMKRRDAAAPSDENAIISRLKSSGYEITGVLEFEGERYDMAAARSEYPGKVLVKRTAVLESRDAERMLEQARRLDADVCLVITDNVSPEARRFTIGSRLHVIRTGEVAELEF